jgi:hypothetical protein
MSSQWLALDQGTLHRSVLRFSLKFVSSGRGGGDLAQAHL